MSLRGRRSPSAPARGLLGGVLAALLLGARPAAAADVVQRWDLEADDGGFVDRYAVSDLPQWSWGPIANGPGAGFDGLNAWSTGRVLDYLNDTSNCLELPLPALDGLAEPMLTFSHWYDIADGDVASLRVDKGAGWELLTPVYGYPDDAGWSGASEGWLEAAVALDGLGSAGRVCLDFHADADGVVSDGWYVDRVILWDGDAAAPRVEDLTRLVDTEEVETPQEVTAVVWDDRRVTRVGLSWQSSAGQEGLVLLDDQGDGAWTGSIPGQAPDVTVSYYIVAEDGDNATRHPGSGAWSYRTYLPAPQHLSGPEGRVVAATAPLTWDPPDTERAVQGYAVFRNDDFVRSVTDTRCDAPLSGGQDVFTVRAVYDLGQGDPSEGVTVDGLVPVIEAVEPAEGFRGDHLRVAVTGQNLLLVDGEVSASLGEGITVVGVDVRAVDLAYLELEIDPDAPEGARDLVLESSVGTTTVAEGFRVRTDAEKPRLVDIEPADAHQGDHLDVTVQVAGGLGGTPTLDFGEGVVVESVDTSTEGFVRAHVAVAGNAPLGQREVTLDDGVRVYSGVSFEVKDAVISTQNNCAHAPGVPLLAPIAAALLLLRRRPRELPGSPPRV